MSDASPLAGELRECRQRYEQELTQNVVPFWEKHAPDRAHGGFHTCLDRDGSVYDTEKYMWMQWRAVYMFATLAVSPYRRETHLPLARQGAEFLLSHGRDPKGQFYFALNDRGEPSVAPYSIYSEAFAAMGCAALYRATKEAHYRDEARAAMRHYLARLECPKGRWEKGLAGRPKRLALGPPMILANLGSVLDECLGTDEYGQDVARACAEVLARFWSPEHKVLFEHVNPDGVFDLASCDGRHINPGHGLEAMWFVMQWAERHGDRAAIAKAARITRALLEFGWDRRDGGLFYFMDVLGKPHQELQHDMKLWWVHNEACVAALYAFHLTRETVFLDWFRRIDEWAWARFRDPEYGEWFAYLDRRGEPTHTLKGGKWKCFFHLPRYLMTCIGLMDRMAG